MYVLDTDHISLAQRQDKYVLANLERFAASQIAVTVISFAEQLQGRLSAVGQARNELEASRRFRYLTQTIEYFEPLQILAYDAPAVAIFERLRAERIRIGTQDLRIASIALTVGAIVVTRNQRDFAKVPDLPIIDWSVS